MDSEKKEAVDERPEITPDPSGGGPEPSTQQPKGPDPNADDEGSKRGLIYRIRRYFKSLKKGSTETGEATSDSTGITGTSTT